MNTYYCKKCTIRPRVVGWPFCHQCMTGLAETYRPQMDQDQREAGEHNAKEATP